MYKVSMKVFLSSILLLTVISNCTIFNQKKETVSTDLVGVVTIKQIQESEHKTWYNQGVGTYVVDVETLADFENNPERIEALSVKIFFGSWCSDSQRELPRFMNIMSFLNVTDLEIIALDRNKKSPKKHEKGMDIHHVPTFVIYQNGKEVNRIIESPIQSLEKDLVAIIQAKKYTPNYSN